MHQRNTSSNHIQGLTYLFEVLLWKFIFLKNLPYSFVPNSKGGGGQIKCIWGKLSRFLKMGFILGHCFIMIKWTSGLFSWNVEFGHSPTVRHKRACWVDNNENIQPNKFSKPMGQYISHSYWKQIFCLKLPFLGSNQHLFVWIHQY